MEPMLCFHCGAPISNKYAAYVALRAKLTNSVKTDTVPERRVLDPEFQVALKPIFDILCLGKLAYCCRSAIMSAQQLDEIGI